MECIYQKVSRGEVDLSDETFRISYGFELQELVRSIGKVGLIQPPILQEISPRRYRVVCGFKRVLALGELGYQQFTAALLPEDVRERDAFLINLYENLSQRNLNQVETAITIDKLKKYFSLEETQGDFLPLLGLGKSLPLMRVYESILELGGEIKMGLAEGAITREIVPMLLTFSSHERLILFQFLKRLQLSRSKQVEVVENLYIIKERDAVAVDTILTHEEVEEILSDRKTGLVAQGDRIREYVRKLRYPQLSKAEEDFRKKKNRLELKGIDLIPPPYFEGEEFRISFSFTTVREYKKKIELLRSIADSEEFREIVEG
jgi:ParB family chromosome partitioning protein